jgi:membrane associated rhomboid family serine protease
MGALVVAGRRLRYDIRQVVILLVINVVIGFLAPGVDWKAHLGGLVTGAAMAAVLVWVPRRHRLLWQVVGTGTILVVLVAVTLWRTAQLRDMLIPTIGI